jgi:hypothetical protein
MKTTILLFCTLTASIHRAQPPVIAEGETNTLSVRIEFKTTVKGQALVPEQTYTNSFGEDYKITAFRYYIGHIELLSNIHAAKIGNDRLYRLCDATIPTSRVIEFSVPSGKYDGISFQLGVDSIDNISGAQEGELDPAKGMFWTWNTGYLMAKLEGESAFSNIPTGMFTYHVGGYKGKYNTIRKVSLNFSPEQHLQIVRTHTITLVIEADIDKWFDSAHKLSIAGRAFVHSPGEWAALYADNCAAMFKLSSMEFK